MQLTTFLEAVNTCLSAAGEAPVNSLDDAPIDAAQARAVLEETSRLVQSEDWYFNREFDVPFPRAPDGTIPIPPNLLKFDLSYEERDDVEPVLRGTRLYNATNHTYTFPRNIRAEVVYLLPWDELTQAARNYIMIRAARVFTDRFVGDNATHQFTADDEYRARVALVSEDLDNAEYNIFDTLEMKLRRRRN